MTAPDLRRKGTCRPVTPGSSSTGPFGFGRPRHCIPRPSNQARSHTIQPVGEISDKVLGPGNSAWSKSITHDNPVSRSQADRSQWPDKDGRTESPVITLGQRPPRRYRARRQAEVLTLIRALATQTSDAVLRALKPDGTPPASGTERALWLVLVQIPDWYDTALQAFELRHEGEGRRQNIEVQGLDISVDPNTLLASIGTVLPTVRGWGRAIREAWHPRSALVDPSELAGLWIVALSHALLAGKPDSRPLSSVRIAGLTRDQKLTTDLVLIVNVSISSLMWRPRRWFGMTEVDHAIASWIIFDSDGKLLRSNITKT